jgi:hypothetical protein
MLVRKRRCLYRRKDVYPPKKKKCLEKERCMETYIIPSF